MNQVIISIEGVQCFQTEEEEHISLSTLGTLHQTEDTLVLSYEESSATGLEGTTTTFEVKPTQITLTRRGSLNSQMIFSRGRRHLSMYDTPYGQMSTAVHTHRLSNFLTPQGGELEFHYDLEVNQQMMGRNFFHITARLKN